MPAYLLPANFDVVHYGLIQYVATDGTAEGSPEYGGAYPKVQGESVVLEPQENMLSPELSLASLEVSHRRIEPAARRSPGFYMLGTADSLDEPRLLITNRRLICKLSRWHGESGQPAGHILLESIELIDLSDTPAFTQITIL